MPEITPYLNSNTGSSPFDQARQARADGSEFWSARDLMPLLGYPEWREFRPAIERAQAAAAAQGHDPADLFGVITEKSGGRPREDFRLARFACYLVAMNGDPRKPEVAAAQAYFAIRTREAETRAAETVRELSDAEIVHRALTITTRQVEALTAENKVLHAAIERDAPLVAKAEAHTGSDGDVHRQEFAREVQAWGRKQNVEIKQAEVLRFLGHIGLFIRGDRSDTGHATADALKRGLAFTHKDVARNGYAYAVGKLTPAGQDYAWRRITAYVGDHGSLTLPHELRGGDPA